MGLVVSVVLFSGISQASSYSVLVGGSIKSTYSFITYGAGANLHTNASIKNNGLFKVSGDAEIVGSLFSASGTHPIEATGNIVLPAQYITIPVLSPQCWSNANYRFEGGASNNSGYIQIYDNNGSLLQTISGGRWSDPSGNDWQYNANLNRWQVEGENPDVLDGIVYFDTAFKTDVPALDIGDPMNAGMLIVNGNFQSESALHIQALFSYEHAIVVFGDAEFHGGEDEESEAEGHKGWIDDSDERNVGYNNLIKGRVYITGNLESTSPTKIDGKLTILGSLDTEGAMRVEYMEGATKVASSIIAQHFSQQVTLAASENFSDPTGGSINMYIFAMGNVSITPTTNFLDLINSVSTFTGGSVLVLGGADETSPPVTTIYNNYPNSDIKGLVQMINALENNYHVNLQDIAITNFIHTYPNDLWVTISLTGTTLGTFLLSRGAQFYSMTTDGLNQYLQRIDSFKTNYPQQWLQYLQASQAQWDYFLQTGTTTPEQTLSLQSLGTLSMLDEYSTPTVCSEDPVITDDNTCILTPVTRHDVPGYFDTHFYNNNLTPDEVLKATILFSPSDKLFSPLVGTSQVYNPPSENTPEYLELFGFNYEQYNSQDYDNVPAYGDNLCGPTAGAAALGYFGLNGSTGYECVYTHDLASIQANSSTYFTVVPPSVQTVDFYPYQTSAYSSPYFEYDMWPYLMLEGDLVGPMNTNNWWYLLGASMPGTDPSDFEWGIESYQMRDYTGKYYNGCFNSGDEIDPTSVWGYVQTEINWGHPAIVLFPNAYGEPHYVTAFGYHQEHYTNVCKTYWTWCLPDIKCQVTTCYPCFNADSFWITYSDNQGDTDVESAIEYAIPVTGYAGTGYIYTMAGGYWAPLYIWIHPNGGTCNNCVAVPPVILGGGGGGGGGSGGGTCTTSMVPLSLSITVSNILMLCLPGIFILIVKKRTKKS